MKYAKLFLILLTLLAAGTGAYGQEGHPPVDDAGANDQAQERRRPNLYAALGLSPEQMQQIRRMNQQRRSTMIEARRRMGDAARNLDAAIYGDAVNDAEVQSRLKEFEAAQAEMSRLRFENELAVRKILTPEQLIRFRDLRRQFTEQRRNNGRRMRRRGQGILPSQGGPFRRPAPE